MVVATIIGAVVAAALGYALLRVKLDVAALQERLVQVELEVAALVYGKKEKSPKGATKKRHSTLREER